MSKLTFKEFLKFSEKEKCIRYKDLSEHDKFLARMTRPTKELTEEEKNEIAKLNTK